MSDTNSAVVREVCRQYIQKRRSGEVKSELNDDSDVLTLMLKTPEVFSDEDIIDELIDFMVAGTQTTNVTTQYAMSHFATDPESLKRARAEFDQVIAKDCKDLDKTEMLQEKFNMESCQDLSYLGYVI